MKQTRRDFLHSTTGLMGYAFAKPLVDIYKEKPKLSFSTLGCPKWTFNQIIKCAVDNGYQGIELRGINGQMDLPKCPEFSPAQIQDTLKQIQDNKLEIVNLGSSAHLHHKDPSKRKTHLDNAKRFIDLAQMINCPFIRVFPDDLPKDQKDEETLELIITALQELGDYTKGSKVTVLLESHGKVVYSDMLQHIMQTTNHPKVGLIWDYMNMWSITKEPPQMVYDKLKKYIKHAHIKDGKLTASKPDYTLLGEGEMPLTEALNALKNGEFKGYYSFEWEKVWHPEIQEPEIALPHYTQAIKKYL
jgi:sugar phosphate isomerase/epimerase